ncbi:hypothetical protein EVAR_73197_1 [Eumeta japonica]|uniref:Uncharacterized protein n=1 Tax=Eumeta variegata TaxID=151549 RepID=A0A4C1T0V7_EUMVA|nr:hypothetical protein EVAR_73197_1 [Eumeta japonica]
MTTRRCLCTLAPTVAGRWGRPGSRCHKHCRGSLKSIKELARARRSPELRGALRRRTSDVSKPNSHYNDAARCFTVALFASSDTLQL